MSRPRAWRRWKNFTKARRKREIDLAVTWYPAFWIGFSDGEYMFPKRGMYDNLHQYSKNKIHCSCPMCSAKTRNKGHRRKAKNYAPSINYTMMDQRRQQAMDADEFDFLKIYDIINIENKAHTAILLNNIRNF